MSLFQNSVLNKYLKALDTEKVNEAYNKFTRHFHNPVIQENIRNSKEEQYQGEFLIDLFVNVLGYTKNPTPNFNLTTELKNIKDSKKTDGAILEGEKALAVIELKGTNTTDLSKVEAQAFGYKRNQPGCNYVITSNFEKLRFYVDNAVDFEEFNLFQLTKERFNILWLCLSSEYLLKDIPKKIKEESLTQEKNITKKLYKDYASFRNEIFDSIQNENPEYDKLTLFKKTQKLLDRFLFIFFAEDRLLLPPNSIRSIVNQWTDLRDKYDEYFPLYDRFKKYFGYMNTGHTGMQHDIFAYNGGLFTPDSILDKIKINDELLYKHTVKLSNYDFESEVSVNVLGHIFEHSLTEIEEIQCELEGVPHDGGKTKRKKEGVFYTPKYITKYIVGNTVGKLCEEKKIELDIIEEEYEKERKGRKKATLKKLNQKLEDYRKWLLQITICDPACGSGAFLNQALEFLITEHSYIDELQAKLFGDAIILSDVENVILENNIYGVDINEEAIEIAKLSLWLYTAQKGRKLTTLNSNIKCGNSLINEAIIAGDKAFDWQQEFPEVFAKGGFDVVIGNPPYVRVENIDFESKRFFESNYEMFTGRADLYIYFYELALQICRQHGMISYITPNKWFRTKYGENIREILAPIKVLEIVDFHELKIFEDASTEPQIITLSNFNNDVTFRYYSVKEIVHFENQQTLPISVSKKSLTKSIWAFIPLNIQNLLLKLEHGNLTLKDYTQNGIGYGIKTGYNDAFIVDEITQKKLIKSNAINKSIITPYLSSQEFDKYVALYKGKHLISTFLGSSLTLEHNHIEVYNHLSEFKNKLESRAQVVRGDHHWTELDNNPGKEMFEIFKEQKIIYIHTAVNHYFYLDKNGYSINNSCYFIRNADELLMAILNSRVFKFYKKYKFVAYGDPDKGGRCKLDRNKMDFVPIPPSSEELKVTFTSRVNEVLAIANRLHKLSSSFCNLIGVKFNLSQLSGKLKSWFELDYKVFLNELEKVRKKTAKENETEYKKLSLSEESDWMQYFNEQKQKAQELKTEIDKTDKEIDQMVYALYGLTEDEINIVENS